MIVDLDEQAYDPGPEPFDVCVAGGGVAGIALAIALADRGRRVIILEAGGRAMSDVSQDHYRGDNVGLENLPLHESRVRALGGSSNHWGGWCRPFDGFDFERNDIAPGGAWPISKEELDPHLEGAARILGVNQAAGADLDLAGSNGALQAIRMFFSRPPAQVGLRFLDTLERSGNIVVLLNAPMTGAEFDKIGGTVTSFRVGSARKAVPDKVTAHLFVLAMGGVENARHLLIWNRFLGDRLGNRSKAIGRFYMQHLHQEVGQFVLLDGGDPVPPDSGSAQLIFLSSTEKLISNSGLGAFRLYTAALGCAGVVDDLKQIVTGARCRSLGSAGAVFATCEQIPNAASHLALDDTNDALGLPRVRMDWRISDGDRRTMLEAAMVFGRYLVRSNLGRLRINRDVLDGAEPLRGWTMLSGAPGAGGHQLGTTRMSGTDADGVVNRNCLVWGSRNLYVVGGSVFRTSAHATPTLTIVQLSLRLAEEIQSRLGSG
jgi:choline dehydrogenase-like flavoprotein